MRWKDHDYKQGIKKALKEHNKDDFILWPDTYESTLEDKEKVELLNEFRTYILNQWDRIFDWRDEVENPSEDARGLGVMESNQRRISFRMKKEPALERARRRSNGENKAGQVKWHITGRIFSLTTKKRENTA